MEALSPPNGEKHMDLYQEIGLMVQLVHPDSYGSDAQVPDAQIICGGHDGILFLVSVGDVANGASGIVGILFDSDVAASDEPAWATDIITFDSDGENELYSIYVDLGLVPGNVVLSTSKIGLSIAITGGDDIELCAVAIPSGGTAKYPITQTNATILT